MHIFFFFLNESIFLDIEYDWCYKISAPIQICAQSKNNIKVRKRSHMDIIYYLILCS